MKLIKLPLFFILFCLIATSCGDTDYVPKPRSYFRIELPERAYRAFDGADCPFQFEIPTYAEINWDTRFFEEDVSGQCMLNVDFPSLGGAIHLTYHTISSEQTREVLYENCHKFSYNHAKQADYIEEIVPSNDHGVEILMHKIGGDAASSMQFCATDGDLHYLNGSLYFEAAPNADSMKPVIDFVQEDMFHLLRTFQWK